MNAGWTAAALLLTLAGAGCGSPDCERYCSKLVECGQQEVPVQNVDQARCRIGCEDSGSSRSETIDCYIDRSCSDIKAGHCFVTGKPPG